MTSINTKNGTRGFSLIEALVVMAILVILFALLLPAYAKNRAQASRIRCISNLKILGVGFYQIARDVVPNPESPRHAQAWKYFQPIGKELGHPQVLICPSDQSRSRFEGLACCVCTGFAGAIVGLSMLNPISSPKAEDCSCKASADAASQAFTPKAEDCSCKADVD